jgi:hypothetical protein
MFDKPILKFKKLHHFSRWGKVVEKEEQQKRRENKKWYFSVPRFYLSLSKFCQKIGAVHQVVGKYYK